jgi:hypothetical protein
MKRISIPCVLLAIFALATNQPCAADTATITQWSFNSGLTPWIGSGSISFLGGVSWAWVSGSPLTVQALNTSVYPAQDSGNKSAGIQFKVSTAECQNIAIWWYQRVSPAASMYERLQYTTNGTNYIDFPTPIVMFTTDNFELKQCDLSSFAAVNNNSNFAFRVVTEFESTATGGTNNDYVTVSGTAYYTVGTVRFDLVTVTAERLAAVLGRAQVSTNGRFQFAVRGAVGSNYVVQAASAFDGLNWMPLVTNAAPFTFTDTTAAHYPVRVYRALLLTQ